MDQGRSMYHTGWQGNQRSPRPRDEFADRPFSLYQGHNRGVTANLVSMATTMKAMSKMKPDPDTGLQPSREDPYARKPDYPRQEVPYARRNGDRQQVNRGYVSNEQPKDQERPYVKKQEDPYSRGNGEQNWTDYPTQQQWPGVGGMIPRAGLPSYRGRYDQPLQAHRSPYVTRHDTSRSLISGSSVSSYGSGSGSDYSNRSGRWISKNKFRLIIGVIIGIVLLALALGGVALWLFLKSDDAYPVTYEVRVRLPGETFVDEMKKTDNTKFKDMQKKYCDAVDEVFGNTLLNCAILQLSSGSVFVLSSLEFDWNDLTDLVKKTGKLPVNENIYAYIKNEIEKSDVKFLQNATASIQAVPETVKYTLNLHLKGMNWTEKLSDLKSDEYKNTSSSYCNGMKEAFSGTMKECEVKKFTEGSVNVESELSFDTKKMKEKAKADGGSIDLSDLGILVQSELKKAANTSAFFKDNELDTEKIEVKSKTIKSKPTIKTTTATTPAATATATTSDSASTSTIISAQSNTTEDTNNGVEATSSTVSPFVSFPTSTATINSSATYNPTDASTATIEQSHETSNVTGDSTASTSSMTITPSNGTMSDSTASTSSMTITPSNGTMSDSTASTSSMTITPSNGTMSDSTASTSSMTITPSNGTMSDSTASTSSMTITPSNGTMSDSTASTSSMTITPSNGTMSDSTPSTSSMTITPSNGTMSDSTPSTSSMTITPSNGTMSDSTESTPLMTITPSSQTMANFTITTPNNATSN